MSNTPVPNFARQWLSQGVEFDENKKSGDFIREIADQLQPALDDLTARLEEVKFQYVFLPWFAGDEDLRYFKTDRQGKAHDKAVAMWIGIAGSAFNSVEITDNKTGEILFIVPPLCDREAVIPAAKDAKTGSIYNMVLTMQQLRNVSSVHARHFFEHEVSKRAMGMFKPDHLLKFVRTWNDIFARYGRPPLLELPGDTTAHTAEGMNNGANAVSQSDDDWELL
jgi:hypothetical protein